MRYDQHHTRGTFPFHHLKSMRISSGTMWTCRFWSHCTTFRQPYRIHRTSSEQCPYPYHVSDINRSSIVTWLCTILLYLFFFIPYVVINVSCRALFVFVALANTPILFRSCISYSLSISYSSTAYFISQILITLSLRSMSISICAPSCSSSPLLLQTEVVDNTPDIPNFFLIWPIWFLHTCSKVSPAHARLARWSNVYLDHSMFLDSKYDSVSPRLKGFK